MPNIIDPSPSLGSSRSHFCMDEPISMPLKLRRFLQLQGKVDKKPQTAAIILAGGWGSASAKKVITAGGDCRQAHPHVVGRGLDARRSWPIVIVCPEERINEYLSRAIDPPRFVTPVVLARQGPFVRSRRSRGLEMVGDEYEYASVMTVPDGARPLVSPDLIEHTINMVKGNFDADGAIVAHPAVDTLKVVEDGVVVGTPDRSVFWNAQTPQVFRAGIYRRAHASALSDGFVGTDDSSLIERLGGKVLIVEGKRDNIKLTVPEDYVLLASAVRTMLLNPEHR